MIKQIDQCRICGNKELLPVLSLGNQFLTGVFPRSPSEKITCGPLELVKCHGEGACGLLQLRHSYESEEMYGANYGYRSGLNQSMVRHLDAKVRRLQAFVSLKPGDVVLDIGANVGLFALSLMERFSGLKIVCIEPAPAQEAVMQQMIVAKGNGARQHSRQVHENSERLVEARRAEHEVMRALVNHHVEVMGEEGPDGV